jgi:hypothetical protein
MAVSVKVEERTISPEDAVLLLARNTHNRSLRPSVVDRYARDMKEGNWTVNGETIQVADDGTIINGQHRLAAVIQSGITIRFFIVTGLPITAQDTIDRNAPRNIADALRMRHESNTNVLAGAISNAIVLTSGTPTTGEWWPSTTEALQFLEAHPNVRASAVVGDRIGRALRTPAVSAAACHFVFSEIDEEDAEAFFDQLAIGADLPNDSPIYRLREFMLKEIAVPRRVGRPQLHARYIKAWNAYRKGNPMTVLTWKTGGAVPEKFPTPI